MRRRFTIHVHDHGLMPKRTDIKSILIIGAGPIVIGQACEFDYSGAQACKALREEGYRVILVNSNPATIMTDPEMADATYIEPVNWQMLEKIIAVERPDALLPTMGGQTGAQLRARPRPQRRAREVRRGDDRRQARGHRQGRGPREVQEGDGAHRARQPALGAGAQHGRGAAGAGDGRLSRPSSGPRSRSAAPAAASPTTRTSSSPSSSAGSTPAPRARC